MRLWTSILKVPGRFQQIPIEQYMDKAPTAFAKEVREAYAYQAEFGWDGGDPSIVHPKDVSPWFHSCQCNSKTVTLTLAFVSST